MKKAIITLAILAPIVASAQLTDSIKRLVPVKGAVNFRDVGGYKTIDGKHVVWGKIFRSDALDQLTPADVALMEKKHIHTVIDFRGTAEAAAAPDRLPPNTDYTLSPAGSENITITADMANQFKEGNFLDKMYYGSDGVKYFGQRYRPLFVKLLTLDKNEALLYHCTGGRDRTGMATALFLYILNVPKETIEADYLASNIYLRPINKKMYAPYVKAIGLTEAEIEQKMELKPELLQKFFEAIKDQYGSVENFLQQEMGIGPKEIEILRKKYTK